MLNDESVLASVREARQIEEFQQSMRRWRNFSIALLILLAAGLVGFGGYALPILRHHSTSLEQDRSSLAKLPNMEGELSKVQQDVKNTGTAIASWSRRQEDLRQQLDRLGRETRVRLDSARKQASVATTALAQRIQSEVERQFDGLRTRLSNLESSEEVGHARIASLQQELTEVRTEQARQANELAAARREMGADVVTAERRMNALQDEQQRDHLKVDSISTQLAVDRADFEVAKGHSQQLAPGISLGLTSTDISHRRLSGWMWLMPDRRTIWLRGHSAQEPVVFYGLMDGKKRELVITHVNKDSVAGYLLVPAGTGPKTVASVVP